MTILRRMLLLPMVIAGALVAAALAPSAAHAGCADWTPSSEWTIRQANNVQVKLTLRRHGDTLAGRASYTARQPNGDPAYIAGDVDGEIHGDSVSFTIFWRYAASGIGVYQGVIATDGSLSGQSWRRDAPGAHVAWSSDTGLTCPIGASVPVIQPCANWDATGPFGTAQTNDAGAALWLRQADNNTIVGESNTQLDPGARGSVIGSISGPAFHIEVDWANAPTTIYEGRISPFGRVEGQHWVKARPGVKYGWFSTTRLACRRYVPGSNPVRYSTDIGGDPVDVAWQRDLRLVSVGGGCSGVLINRAWVLTAEACITANGAPDGPSATLDSKVITAAWSRQAVTPTVFVRYGAARGVHVALVGLGDVDFGEVGASLIDPNPAEFNQPMAQLGHGVCAFAHLQAGGDYLASERGCSWRVEFFEAKTTGSPDRFEQSAPNDFGQYPAGDGGPVFAATAIGGGLVGIAGVSVGCAYDYALGHSAELRWVTRIPTCRYASLANIRGEIIATTRKAPMHSAAVGQVERRTGDGPHLPIERHPPIDARAGQHAPVSEPHSPPVFTPRPTQALPDVGARAGPGAPPASSPREGPASGSSTPPRAPTTPQPIPCQVGFVWRMAGPSDYVCVTPRERERAQQENDDADSHAGQGGQPCAPDLVTRDAFDGDRVCVRPGARRRTQEENALSIQRQARS